MRFAGADLRQILFAMRDVPACSRERITFGEKSFQKFRVAGAIGFARGVQAFENDGFRRAWLSEVAAQAGHSWQPIDGPGFTEQRELMLNRLADAVTEHLDTEALLHLIETGPPAHLPLIASSQVTP
jgi:adenosylcobyric acid synthase